MIFVGWAEPVSDTRSLQAERALRRGLDQRAGRGQEEVLRERTSSRFMSLCLSLSPVDSTGVFPQTDAGLGPRRVSVLRVAQGPGSRAGERQGVSGEAGGPSRPRGDGAAAGGSTAERDGHFRGNAA